MIADFMRSEVAKKDGFRILSIAQSQSYNPRKNVADVKITIAFSFFGEQSERPSQRFDPKKIEESSKFSSRAPAVRQPEVPVAHSAMPDRASSVPQVRPANSR